MALKKPPIQLETFMDMFPDKQEPKVVAMGGISEMEFSKMLPFPNHKYKLYEGQRLQDMVVSIHEFGIITPIILWHTEKDEYIILSGHNRKNAGQLAGLEKAPVVIKTDLSLEEARLIVNETNLRQRSFTDLSHSERAYCLSEHYDAMKSQGKRNDLLKEIEMLLNPSDSKENSTSSEVQTKLRTDEKIGQDYGLSKDKVAKYIRISNLNEPLMEMLDNNEIAFLTAYTLSFIEDENAKNVIAELVMEQGYKLDMKKADLLRDYFDKGKLSDTTIDEILSGEKDKKPKSTVPKPVKVKNTVIKKYFTANETPKEIEETIEKALEVYFELLKSQEDVQDDDMESEVHEL